MVEGQGPVQGSKMTYRIAKLKHALLAGPAFWVVALHMGLRKFAATLGLLVDAAQQYEPAYSVYQSAVRHIPVAATYTCFDCSGKVIALLQTDQ